MTPPPPAPNLYLSAVSYHAALLSAGWVLIGQGVGGKVFHRAGDVEVVKVSEGDNCYLAFASYAMAHRSSCTPNLQIVFQNSLWAVTHIEHLQPLVPANIAAIGAWWAAYLVAKKAKASPPLPAEWSGLADALWPIASNGNCGFDMKPANAIQRGQTVVFIDPLN